MNEERDTAPPGYPASIQSIRRKRPIASLLCSAIYFLITVPLALGDAVVTVGPYLQNVTPRSMVIMWETSVPVENHVAYWSAAQDKVYAVSPRLVMRHESLLDDLEQDTIYGYAVILDGKEVFESTFRTAPDSARSFRFVAYGDSRSNPQVHETVIEGIINSHPEIVLHTGDLVGVGENYASWAPEFFGPARNLMHDTPMFPTLGNHEYSYSGRSWFSSLLALPNNEQWFAFTYGNVRFIGLDTNVAFYPNSVQYRWFEAELKSAASREATWRVVYFHHSAFTASRYRDDSDIVQYLVPLIEAGGVDLVFSGHTHAYERYLHNGVSYIVTGGGGTFLYALVDDVEAPLRLAGSSVFHYCVVDVDVPGQSLTLSAHLTDGTPFDELTLTETVIDPNLPAELTNTPNE